jgi:hypothetical protein
VLFHHDPLHTDDQLESMLAEAQPGATATSVPVELGYEGQVLQL